MPVFLVHAIEDSTDIFGISGGGVWTPQTTSLGTPLMSVYFVGRLGDEEVKVHYCLVGCDSVYTASSFKVSIVWRTFLIHGYYIATTVLLVLKIPLFEMVVCSPPPIWSSRKYIYIYMCVCVCVCVEPLSQNTVYPKTSSCNLIHIYPAVNLSRSLYHSTAVLSMCCWRHFRRCSWNPRTENH